MIEIYQIILLVAFILLSGVFSASETALIAISRFKVKLYTQKNRKGSGYLASLKENPHHMLSTLLICNNVVNIGGSALATSMALEVFKSNAVAFSTGIMTFFILVFGEIVPKNYANAHSGKISLFIAPLIHFLSIILRPLIVVFDFITTKIFRVLPRRQRITEEEIRNIVDIAREEGGIDKQEKEMIHRIFKFDDIDVDAIKVPRIDMVMIQLNSTLGDALKIINKKKFARLPVYEGHKDKIMGMFYYKDAFSYIQKGKFDTPIAKLLRRPLFIPETKKIDEMLKLFQMKKQQMAIIVDEHGGVSGLVTVEDILEEIVGEIADEAEPVEQEIIKQSGDTYKILGKASIHEVNRKTKTKFIATEDFDTISGLIMHELGSIPKVGEEIVVEGVKLKVKKIEEHRIIEVELKK
ncbi:HlyC/CorC family transporter [Candidatus Woesearchaeota archaeon]|nr:HlyC/CorC family transporter [Candidatus Woesearchaeota archaeon]